MPAHRLAAIMFTDIVGYTALMQADEAAGIAKASKLRTAVETLLPQHGGELIEMRGDGAFCLFASSTEAVRCAVRIQQALRAEVPLRIGLHLGDITEREGHIFGDAVNIASRIESMGVPGAVLLSDSIHRQIKNKPEFELEALGSHHFKNVEAPMALYAIANAGLAVPKPTEMKGKLTQPSNQASFFQRIWSKRIPQVLIAYLLVAWLGVQLIEWAMDKSGLSPYWSQIFLITLIGLLPSLLVYLQHRERIQRLQLKLSEKILFPANLLVVGIVLFFMFRTAELGATTTNITFLNADGEEETHEIVKEEFRLQFPIFPFEPMGELKPTDPHAGANMSSYLSFMLNQDKYLAPSPIILPWNRLQEQAFFTKVEKINTTKLYKSDFYIDGQVERHDSLFVYIPAVRDKRTGSVLQQTSISAPDIWEAADSVTAFLRKAVGLTQAQRAESMILTSKEVSTDNYEALTAYAQGLIENRYVNFERAIALDSNFVFPAIELAQDLHRNSRGSLEAKWAIDRAMRNRKKLPYHHQITIMMYKHLIYGEWERAEQLLKIQLEIEPSNESYHYLLQNLYWITGQVDQVIRHAENRYAEAPSLGTAWQAMRAALMKGEPDYVVRNVNLFLKADPRQIGALRLLAQAYTHQQAYEKARETYEKMMLINPEMEPFIQPALKSIAYLEAHPPTQADLAQFEGVYRRESTEMNLYVQVIGGQLYVRTGNQPGFFTYLSGERQFLTPFSQSVVYHDFLPNEAGDMDALHITVAGRTEQAKRYYYQWKQDSLIWQAEEALRQGAYEAARKAYETSLARHPEHYYLQQALDHLDYLEDQSEEALQRQFDKLAGSYEEGMEVWIENGLLYFKRPGVSRRILRPLSDRRFTSLLFYGWNYEFVEEAGEITGVRGYRYDAEQGSWNLVEDWYFARVGE